MAEVLFAPAKDTMFTGSKHRFAATVTQRRLRVNRDDVIAQGVLGTTH
jgi:hypothetical protein